jgi:hypothetical protein
MNYTLISLTNKVIDILQGKKKFKLYYQKKLEDNPIFKKELAKRLAKELKKELFK